MRVSGRKGVRRNAKAVFVNVTAARPRANGYITVYPWGPRRPPTSTLNYTAGVNVANGAVVDVGEHGIICVFALQATGLAVDVSGFFPQNSAYTPVRSFRRANTQIESEYVPEDKLEICFPVAEFGTIPRGVSAVFVNLVAVVPPADGFLTAFSRDLPVVPETSNLNYRAGRTAAIGAFVELSRDGAACVYTHTRTHFIVDISGYVNRRL